MAFLLVTALILCFVWQIDKCVRVKDITFDRGHSDRFWIFVHPQKTELNETLQCFVCANIFILREYKKSSERCLSLDMTDWKQHLQRHDYGVCFFHSAQLIIHPNWMNHANFMNTQHSHCSRTKPSDISFIQPLYHSLFSFIVAVTACCQPPSPPPPPPHCVAWRGGFIPRWQIQWWHWHRWSDAFSQESPSLFLFSWLSKTSSGVIPGEYPCRCWHGQRKEEASVKSSPALQTKTKLGCTLTSLTWRCLGFVCCTVYQCVWKDVPLGYDKTFETDLKNCIALVMDTCSVTHFLV